ncbi:hypothetical protein BKM88_00185 [Anaplasma marginale]|uniref:P44/Msp2 family outer membrane protein n=1 Tax=Anaplasma marginale TaxID=770 RepID=UPI000E87B8EF|nr:hypothetical protein BKM88_00185 [Anaplasma marginale]
MVAGAFARAVEGAEVIEVRAIGSTSVMLNACYDLLTDGIGVVPYACAGIGRLLISCTAELSPIRCCRSLCLVLCWQCLQ